MTERERLIGLVVVVVVGAALFVLYWPPPEPKCQFAGWKQSIGVELEVVVKNVEKVQGEIGVARDHARQLDTLLRDYATRYDAACIDLENERITEEEYRCLRRHLERQLEDLRTLAEVSNAAATLEGSPEKAELLKKTLEQILARAKSHYDNGCFAGLSVAPQVVPFGPSDLVRVISVSNSGSRVLTYNLRGVPSGFIDKPSYGRVEPGAVVSVALTRTRLPVPDGPLVFEVMSSSGETQEVTIQLATLGSIYKPLAEEAKLLASSGTPGAKEAGAVVDGALKEAGVVVDESVRLLASSEVLAEAGENEQALQILEKAIGLSSNAKSDASELMMKGILAARLGRTKDAFREFEYAKTYATTSKIKEQSEIFSLALLARTNRPLAKTQLDDAKAQQALEANPELVEWLAKEFGVEDFAELAK